MGWQTEARVKLVQALRKAARECKVPQVSDNASRPKVRAMVQAILATTDAQLEKTRAAARQDLEDFEATFPSAKREKGATAPGAKKEDTECDKGEDDESDEGEDDECDKEENDECDKGDESNNVCDKGNESNNAVYQFRLRGTSFLFTYNWDFLGQAFPDGTSAPRTVEDLWRMWRKWKKQKKKEMGVARSTSTMEESLHAVVDRRVHLHWKVDLKVALDWSSKKGAAFHGVLPDVRRQWMEQDGNAARGSAAAMASNRAHFYCYAPKLGTLFTTTNWWPWRDYRVLGKWLDDLWTDGKLSHGDYKTLSLRVRKGHAARKRDLEAVLADEREREVDEQIVRVNGCLQQLLLPSRDFPQVEQWETSFLYLDCRWKVLALCADSAAGKSTFAEARFDKPFVITVEDATNLDLKGFDARQYDGIVLDNVNSWAQLRSWRAILQARNAKSKGGQSGTNIYAYVQYLFGVPIIATVDLDAPDSYLVEEGHPDASRWLLKNCEIVRLQAGETFYKKRQDAAPQIPNTFSLFAETVRKRRRM